MSLILHLGVNDVPYVDEQGKTTGDIAQILEGKYHIMETFYESHSQQIADVLANGLEGALESVMSGSRINLDQVFLGGTTRIDEMFKDYLSNAEIEHAGIPGVPTKAAIERRSARFKKGKGKNRRPSFIDTGQYQANFHSWVDNG